MLVSAEIHLGEEPDGVSALPVSKTLHEAGREIKVSLYSLGIASASLLDAVSS
jgi:hypothetical protein